MTRTFWGTTLALFLSAAALATAAGRDNPVSKPPPVPPDECGGVPYWGTVTELTKESITIQFADEKPKRFPISETLAAGKIPKDPRPLPGRNYKYVVTAPDMYRLTDVKVGDWVAIKYSTVGGLVICDHVCIQKRPGGRVPPLSAEVEALRKYPIRYDEFVNAYWDLEDKGIPYPEKFGRNRRFPVAPLPREVPIPKLQDAELQCAAPVLQDDLTKLESAFGTWADPDKDCKFKLTGGEFKVSLPATDHLLGKSLTGARNNAPRALRQVDGDFTAVVRVLIPIPDLDPKSSWQYWSGGLVAWESDEGYFGVRLCGGRVSDKREAIYGHHLSATNQSTTVQGLGKPTGKAFVRLKREGKKVAAGWSRDGKEWKDFDSSPQEVAWGAKVKVGVVAENNLGVPVEVTFDQYTLSQPKK